MHRLFWEYGATAVQANTLGAAAWRSFVLRLAEEFLQGRKRHPRTAVEALGGGSATAPDAVYRRVSSIVDGAFAQTGDWGDVEFEADFVRHALGLALVRKLEGKSKSESKEALERFFEPLNEHDEEAEIVRAAVSIALAKGGEEQDSLLPELCGHWVRCQNLPDSHLSELERLAPELVEPLLDVVEATGGHGASSPRYRAVNALDKVDQGDASVSRAIANRGARWLAWISQERGADGAGEDSTRSARLESRIGTSNAGCVTVLGREMEIVAQVDEHLGVVGTQLLQGRPLEEAIGFFEAAALQLAICGEPIEEMRWLNMVNDVDPAKTAKLLRELSEAMLQRQPEAGVHEHLNERVAAILLWWTGYQEDADRAVEVEPGLDRLHPYAEAYEKDPAKSLFALERRHATETLGRADVAFRVRIQRAAEFLVDPSLAVPRGFVEEAIQAAHDLDWGNMAIKGSRTTEDWTWRDLRRVLARVAPDELASIERGRLRGFAAREGPARSGAATVAADAMLLVGDPERRALRVLRDRRPPEPEDIESLTQTRLLVAELQGEGAVDQARRIAEAELDGVDASLARACGAPSMEELEHLVEAQRGDPVGLQRLTEIIGEKPATLGEQAFDAFVGLLFGGVGDVEKLAPVWVVLGLNAAGRVGALLDERGWAWSREKPYIENVLGSMAVAAANRQTPFDQFAARLAPAAILGVVSDRGGAHDEVKLAVNLVGRIVMQGGAAVPETPLEVSHDRTEAEGTLNYLYSYGDIREKDELDDIGRFFSRTQEDYQERRRALATRYFEEVMDARRQGVNFHLEFVRPEHLRLVLDRCPEAADEWLHGMAERSPAFTKRAQLADGLYVSLCEALLARKPDLGVELWHALNDCLTHASFTVHGDMDRLVEALFAAKSSAKVEQTLEDVYGLGRTRSDHELVSLVVAARRYDQVGWLRRMVAKDEDSECPLHRQRATFLKPLLSVPDVAGEDGWPQGPATGVAGTSWKLGQREAFALHWLRTFCRSESVTEAHAAWQLFLACVDRRVWSWLKDELDRGLVDEGPHVGLHEVKRRFVVQQKREIRRAIGENEKQWGDSFTTWRCPRALKPWSLDR